ncbi:MAG: TolC family protein [Thermodesulfobacteriota bacterium]
MKAKKKILLTVLACCLATVARGQNLDEVQLLDLATAQEISLSGNPSLAAAAERVEQARQRVAQARGQYWPSVDADGSVGAHRMSVTDAHLQSIPTAGVDVERNYERYNLSLSTSWLLFDGFSRKFSNLVAEYGEQESEQARRDGMRLLLQSVAESYYAAQLARYNKTIGEADFSFNSKQAEEAKVSMEAGAGPLSAVLNFQVQMNNARTDILLAERNYELALYGLALLLGRENGRMPEGLELAEIDMVEEGAFYDLAPEQLLQTASAHRPDLLGGELTLQRTESVVGARQATFYPRLALRGSLDGKRIDEVDLGADDFGSSLSVNLSYNLFRGGSDRARVAEAKAAKREAARNLEQRRNKVQSEVYQAITKLEQAQEQLLLQRASVKLVEQSRDLVEEGYKAGQESLARLNEVQRDLVRTQSRLALSLIGLYNNRQGLKSATGESLTPYLPKESEE